MKYFYGQYSGEEFPTQDKLFGFDQMIWPHTLELAIQAIDEATSSPKNKSGTSSTTTRWATGYCPSLCQTNR